MARILVVWMRCRDVNLHSEKHSSECNTEIKVENKQMSTTARKEDWILNSECKLVARLITNDPLQGYASSRLTVTSIFLRLLGETSDLFFLIS